MRCPFCGAATGVHKTRHVAISDLDPAVEGHSAGCVEAISVPQRWRECTNGHKFRTVEIAWSTDVYNWPLMEATGVRDTGVPPPAPPPAPNSVVLDDDGYEDVPAEAHVDAKSLGF